jgi:hypothetical protein
MNGWRRRRRMEEREKWRMGELEMGTKRKGE